jgi:carbamoyl-phosphate synthase large subunit
MVAIAPVRGWTDVLRDIWWVAPIAFGVSLVVTPVVRHVAYRWGIVDRPDELLKPHHRPVAYLGGAAMCIGLLAGLGAHLAALPDLADQWRDLLDRLSTGRILGGWNPIWGFGMFALACLEITAVGLLDDVREIAPAKKVAGQLLAAALLLAGGIGTRMAAMFLGPLGLGDVVWLMTSLSIVLCALMVIACCNATNLLDGLDGLCGGVSAVIAVGFLALAVWLAMWPNQPSDLNALRVAICLAMVGAVLGFLPYNMHPASIFMGDAGSMLLGLAVATVMALLCQEGTARWFLASLVVFAVPVLDTSLAVVRRLRAGRSIFAGDRSHLYDQLIDRGMPLMKVVLLFYVLTAVSAALGVLSARYLRLRYALPLYAMLFVLVWVAFYLIGAIRAEERRPGRRRRARDLIEHPARGVPGGGKGLSLLFTSAGRRVALLEAFRRAADHLGAPLTVHAVDQQPMAPALQSADVAQVVSAVTSDEYVESLLDYCRRHEVAALIPLIDPELPTIAGAAERFAQLGTTAVISSPDVVRVASDKVLTHDFLRRHGFQTPRILDGDELRSPRFPLFAKPRHGSSSHGTGRIDTSEDLQYFLRGDADCVIQEFVHGVEHTVDVFADFEGRPRCAVPRRRHEVRAGEVSKGQTVRHERMMAESSRLVEALGGCKGVITIQCFLTPDQGLVFIEINPRFGGGVPLSIRAGADSPRWILELLLGRRPDIRPDAWTDGLFMLRYDEAFFATRDALPPPAAR